MYTSVYFFEVGGGGMVPAPRTSEQIFLALTELSVIKALEKQANIASQTLLFES